MSTVIAFSTSRADDALKRINETTNGKDLSEATKERICAAVSDGKLRVCDPFMHGKRLQVHFTELGLKDVEAEFGGTDSDAQFKAIYKIIPEWDA